MAIEKLQDRQIKALAKSKSGKSDGGGLYFEGRGDGQAQILFTYQWKGTKERLYIGMYPAMTLADARKQAAKWRAIHAAGDNPKAFKARIDRDERFPPRTLEDVASEFWDDVKSPTLFHGEKPNQWFNPMRLYMLEPEKDHFPHGFKVKLGKRNMEDISIHEMAKLILEIRNHSNDQARKAIICLRQIFKYARGICGQNVDRNFMDDVEDGLPIDHRGRKKKPQRKRHLPVTELRAFYQSLGDSLDDLAMRFLMLTALRTQNMRWLTWDEIHGNLWVQEGDRMKSKEDEDFIQPLSREAMNVIRLALAHRSNSGNYVFHNSKAFKKGVITENRLNDILKERGVYGNDLMKTVTGHGFRTSFMTWGFKTYGVDDPLIRECMAHKVVKGVGWHYDQDPRIEERRERLESWGQFLTAPVETTAPAPNIIQFGR
ncbi:integrase arm-type DNA-binding domain-containing protein [uncultured Tateyamaria sp.]|uniref:tyrosine-type recombinase/integrase n=1 Tax=uncultured Tateyamaria sp. TaxID=455651 RepID=UPI002616A93F|nr:integrase arm-type DNA-binding domain-containing protein [uncultured Tateyamaria sp.]